MIALECPSVLPYSRSIQFLPSYRKLKMHSSFFNYNLQRPYPFKWFTPVLLVGGIILAVLLSIMNFVQNSYVLVAQYVDDPNSTITQGVWYRDWPSYLTNGVQPTCEPVNLPVNTQLFTNQSGLMWTITSLFKDKESPQAVPSLPYLNNALKDCSISELRLEYDDTKDQDVSVLQYIEWGMEIRAFVTCSVSGPSGNTFVNATAVYNALTPYEMPGVSSFVAQNATGRASMFWSEVLLRAYWINAVSKVWAVSNHMFQNDGASLSKGVVTLYPNRSPRSISDLDFFDMQYDFLEKRSGFGFTGPLNSIKYYIESKNANSANPHIWTSVNQFAKSMYSAVLADLGQTQYPSQSSLVTEGSTIQKYTSTFSDPSKWNLPGGIPPMLLREDYNARQSGPDPTGRLGLSSSVVATEYLCQVPRRKPVGDIFVSVLLADLVFLQFAWKLYIVFADRLLAHKQPNAMVCQACADGEDPEVETIPGPHASVRYPIKGGMVSSSVTFVDKGIADTRSIGPGRF